MAQTKQNMSKTTKRKVFLKASDFFLDVAKLIFAGVILGGIMARDVEGWLLFSFGGVAVFLSGLVGYVFFVRGIKTN